MLFSKLDMPDAFSRKKDKTQLGKGRIPSKKSRLQVNESLCEKMGHCNITSQSVRHLNGSLIQPVALAPPGHTSFQKVNTESHVAASVQSLLLASCDKFSENKSLPSLFSKFSPPWKGKYFVERVVHENQCYPLLLMVILFNKSCSHTLWGNSLSMFVRTSLECERLKDLDIKSVILKIDPSIYVKRTNWDTWHPWLTNLKPIEGSYFCASFNSTTLSQ